MTMPQSASNGAPLGHTMESACVTCGLPDSMGWQVFEGGVVEVVCQVCGGNAISGTPAGNRVSRREAGWEWGNPDA